MTAATFEERLQALEARFEERVEKLEHERDEYKKLAGLLQEQVERLKLGLLGQKAERLPKTTRSCRFRFSTWRSEETLWRRRRQASPYKRCPSTNAESPSESLFRRIFRA